VRRREINGVGGEMGINEEKGFFKGEREGQYRLDKGSRRRNCPLSNSGMRLDAFQRWI